VILAGWAQRAQKKLKLMAGSTATRLLIVRHGETNWNKEGRLQGQTDSETVLNEVGLLQASAVRADRRQTGPQFSCCC
jgi:broad specificity phosphatase PhoE